MSGKPTALFDAIAFATMQPGRYLKVHPRIVNDPDTGKSNSVDPRAGNPFSTGRLARRPPYPREPSSIAMSYVATTGAAALFEALFRNAKMLPDREVYFEPAKLDNMCLTELTLGRPIAVFPADLPDRKMVVTDPAKDDLWRELIRTAHHPSTWAAAVSLTFQLHAAGKDLGGITWNSVQCPQGGAVYLLYDPPNGREVWTTVRTTRLDSERGRAAIRRELRAFGYTWIDTSTVDDQASPPDAL